MLKQIIVTLDTSDPLQAQLLVEYLASHDRVRFGRCCMLLGYLAGTQPPPNTEHAAAEDISATPTSSEHRVSADNAGVHASTIADSAPPPVKEENKTYAKPKIGGGLFGLD